MWNINWFVARRFAYAGTPVRRAAWTRWIVYYNGVVWSILADGSQHVARATEVTAEDLRAGDWTTLPASLQCGLVVPGQLAVPPAPPWAGFESWGPGFVTPPPAPFYLA